MDFISDMKMSWDKWEVQAYTLLAITFQISLVTFGSERKRVAKSWIKAFVWICFLGAIWAVESATENLGTNALCSDIKDYAKVKRFWPPFLLIVLGSPDTITAYAIEDNSLWLRLLLTFITDVGGAIYVFILTWSNDKITYLAAAMYIVGIIKYGERAYVRHKSNFENFRDSLLSKPDPFPDIIKIKKQDIEKYHEIMRDNQLEPLAGQPRNSEILRTEIVEGSESRDFKGEGSAEESRKSDIERGEILEESKDKVVEQERLMEELAKSDVELGRSAENIVIEQEGSAEESAKLAIELGEVEESDLLFQAFFWFKRFAHLFAGLILDNDEGLLSIRIFERKKAEDAFNLVAIELGIMYDVLYTKATIVYSRIGILLRCISVVLSVSVFVVFFSIVDLDHYTQSTGEIFITYVLLLTNAYVECFGVILLFNSDWATIIRLTKFYNCTNRPNKFNNRCFAKRKRWSGAMGQFNLISSCLKEVSASRIGFRKLYSIANPLKMSQYRSWENVSVELLDIIFKQLKKKTERLGQDFVNIHFRRKILAERGDYVLQDQGYNVLDDFREFILDVDFDHSLLLWHIATDLCYSYDFGGLEGSCNAEEGASVDEGASNAEGALKNGKISKCLSDYMLYLLVICPSMMPHGIGELRFADAFAIAKNFFKAKEDLKSKSKKQVCEILLKVKPNEISVGEGLADKHLYSVLKEGIELAQKLKELDTKADWGREKKWRMVSEVWLEMLAYAASTSHWIAHGCRLSRGGELLTHVCLVMAHLGLSDQYREKGRKIND